MRKSAASTLLTDWLNETVIWFMFVIFVPGTGTTLVSTGDTPVTKKISGSTRKSSFVAPKLNAWMQKTFVPSTRFVCAPVLAITSEVVASWLELDELV